MEPLESSNQSMTAIKPYIAERGLAEEMFRLAVEACPSGMVMTDRGKMVMVNTEIENQFGYSREELIGRDVELLVPERSRAQHILHRRNFTPQAEDRRIEAGRELHGRRKDGSEFAIEVGLNPIRAGERLLVLAVIVDISHRKQMERLKDEFVATVSHELRTPLTSIAGSLGLLAGQWSDSLPEKASRLVSIAHKNAQRLVRLINDILDIEKIESGRAAFNFAQVELRQIAVQAIEDIRGFAGEFGVHIRLDAASVEADVNADPDRLVQVITNLLSNAIKYSSRGGEVLVGVAKRGNACRVTVRDHGPGIPQEFRSHIFGKFAQADGTDARRNGGTGLGLSIVKEIVERLGGEVGFDDARGGGTIFHVELPAWDGTAGGEIDVDVEASPPRLLLCEDDTLVAKVVRARMHSAGFAVDFAHTPDTAILRASATRYAAIMVDLRLRDNDGIDLILRLRALPYHGQMPIVVISGDPERGLSDVRSSRLNILEWFNKPIDFAHLTRTLQAATAPKRARPRILHIDDNRDTLDVVARKLSPMAEVISADCVANALQAIADKPVDLVVLDIGLGEHSGLDLLPDLRYPTGNEIPVILFSADAAHVEGANGIASALPGTNASLESLAAAVHDRLALLPVQAA